MVSVSTALYNYSICTFSTVPCKSMVSVPAVLYSNCVTVQCTSMVSVPTVTVQCTNIVSVPTVTVQCTNIVSVPAVTVQCTSIVSVPAVTVQCTSIVSVPTVTVQCTSIVSVPTVLYKYSICTCSNCTMYKSVSVPAVTVTIPYCVLKSKEASSKTSRVVLKEEVSSVVESYILEQWEKKNEETKLLKGTVSEISSDPCTVVNRILPSLHWRSLEITLTAI